MLEALLIFVSQFPKWLATIMLAMLPIAELRVAIPVAAEVWLIHPANAFALAVIGNLLPFFLLFYGLKWVREQIAPYLPWLTNMIDRQIDRAGTRMQKKYDKYGAFALFLFTALPLPFTGLWTATLAAVALKIPVKYALAGVVSGVIVAGILVSVLTVSADVFF